MKMQPIAPRWRLRIVAHAVCFMLVSLALAQEAAAPAPAPYQLVVNGVSVPGLTTTLVTDVAYIPASVVATVLGADVFVESGVGRVTFNLGAAIVQFVLVDDVLEAPTTIPAVARDGVVREGPAAVWDGQQAFVPVRALAEAFGGRVAPIPELRQIALLLPRPNLSARLERDGSSVRLHFTLDSPGSFSSSWRPQSRELEIAFPRARPATFDAPPTGAFLSVSVATAAAIASVRIQLAVGVEPRVWSVPKDDGIEVVVSLVPSLGGAAGVTLTERWVIDAGAPLVAAVGANLLTQPEGRTRAFADALWEAMQRLGVDVERTRLGPSPVPLADRSALGVGAAAFVSIYEADLPRRQVRVSALGDADSLLSLERAIRVNAEAALGAEETDALRRSLLLRLVPDLAFGRAWAEALAGPLSQAGWVVVGPQVAPLAPLVGAAGRGLMLEVSADDLADPTWAAFLANALLESWRQASP